MKIIIILLLILYNLTGCTAKDNEATGKSKPNVLFVSVDDLNDWIHPLKGHAQARTPNLDKLTNSGVRNIGHLLTGLYQFLPKLPGADIKWN